MSTEKEIFKIQADFIKQAADLIEERAKAIEKVEKAAAYNTASESEKKAAIGIFKIRSLRLCRDTLLYIADEVIRDDPKIGFFLMPHARTILDVYARFIHLLENCSGEDDQALVCIAYQLLLPKYLESEVEYQKTFNLYKNFFKQINFNFPTDLAVYSKNWVKNNNLNFADAKSLLTTNNLKKYALNVGSVFGVEETYRIYSGFSEFLHGNPYYYNESPHNERFWVVAICLSTAAFFIELIDLHTLKKRNPRDFRMWLDVVKKNKIDFINLWKSQVIPRH